MEVVLKTFCLPKKVLPDQNRWEQSIWALEGPIKAPEGLIRPFLRYFSGILKAFFKICFTTFSVFVPFFLRPSRAL